MNMKKTMKKQSKKFSLLGCKGLLSIVLSSLAVVAFAQGAEVCQGTGYMITDAVPASVGSEYRWLENGDVLPNTNQTAYNVPNNKAAGVYTYVRQAKSAECSEWQSSNEFTVTVFNCTFSAGTKTGATATFTDPRDGKQYKTVVMPDGRTWFAQNLNYTKDLTFNMYAHEANGKLFTSAGSGVAAIGSYWCPAVHGSSYSGDQNTCNIYGALYSWETAMMVDGKYSDDSRKSSEWDVSWVSLYRSGAPATTPNADRNNARGGSDVKGGGRGICPKGWHIPTVREWAVMLDSVERKSIFSQSDTSSAWRGSNTGLHLNSVDTHSPPCDGKTLDGSWCQSPVTPTNSTGFAMQPSGLRDYGSTSHFYNVGVQAGLYSSTPYSKDAAWHVRTQYDNTGAIIKLNSNCLGFAARCLLD
jgi:uncharacterized protein (TIGR02145 family)